MSYKVIKYFTDIQDCYFPYNVGDVFPRVGKDVSAERIKELSTGANRQGVPLIELVADSKVVEQPKIEVVESVPVKQDTIVKEQTTSDVKYTKTEINRLSTKELKEVAANAGIEDIDSLTGTQLKKMLIKKFRL